jgi:PTH2 family peptidyl-tRNA hydrolase
MPKGKLAAQAAHASMMFLLKWFFDAGGDDCGIRLERKEFNWYMYSGMCKVVLKVDSLEQLEQLQEKAKAAGLQAHFVCDAGRTTFHEPTVTCLAIGPDDEAAIDAITGELSLL